MNDKIFKEMLRDGVKEKRQVSLDKLDDLSFLRENYYEVEEAAQMPGNLRAPKPRERNRRGVSGRATADPEDFDQDEFDKKNAEEQAQATAAEAAETKNQGFVARGKANLQKVKDLFSKKRGKSAAAGTGAGSGAGTGDATPGGSEAGETGPDPSGQQVPGQDPDVTPGQEAGADSDNDGIPDVIDVPAFDMKIMDNILGVPLVKHTVRNFAKLGAALGKEEDQEVIKAFKSVLLPALASFQKKAHIDIAEHMSMQEMLLEANEPLSKRQAAYKKGRSRKGLGIKAYLKSMGGKEPKFTRMLVASLEKSLIDGADKKFSAAFQKALSGVKDKKAQKEQAKFFQKSPEKRLEAYKHNATEIINQVRKISNLAAKKAMAKHKKKPQRALPEQ